MKGPDEPRGGSTAAFFGRNTTLTLLVLAGSGGLVGGLYLLAGVNPGIGAGLLAAILLAGASIYRLWNGPIDRGAHQPLGRSLASGLAALVLVALAIQAVPYGRDHSNPPVTAEPSWDSARTRQLAVAACFDCHSNEVDYPAYASIAPFSWAVADHVEEGRERLNFSEWDRRQGEAHEAAETVLEGEMPPFYYMVAHPDARLTDAEKRELADGLRASLGG
jgi:hypothetical protein